MKSVKNIKTVKSRRDCAVQGTNDSSIVSKVSMSELGYIEDAFLQHFVETKRRRSPLINRGYYIRAKAVETVFKNFLNSSRDGTAKQIISFGAGFDSSYFRLKEKGLLTNTVFVEVDFPAVVQRKLSRIRQTPELTRLLGTAVTQPSGEAPPEIVYRGCDYALLGVDLARLDQFSAVLAQLDLDLSRPMLCLSEVALTYMPHTLADPVITWAATHLQNGAFVAYEQIRPKDGFGRVMLAHFDKLGSPLRCITTYPSMEAQTQRFRHLGWSSCETIDMNAFYRNCLSCEEKRRMNALEPFDEFETWHLKCSHYALICAANGCLVDQVLPTGMSLEDKEDRHQCLKTNTSDLVVSGSDMDTKSEPVIKVKLINADCASSKAASLRRYAHKCVTLSGGLVLLVGGFGETAGGGHKRVQTLSCIDCSSIQNDGGGDFQSESENAMSTGLSQLNMSNMDMKITETVKEKLVIYQLDQTATQGNCCANSRSSHTAHLDLMYHTATALSDERIVITGGRRSPVKPNTDLVILTVNSELIKRDLRTLKHCGYKCTNEKQNGVDGSINSSQMINVHNNPRDTENTLVEVYDNDAKSHDSDGTSRDSGCECHPPAVDLNEVHYEISTVPVANTVLHRWRHTATLVSIDGGECVLVYGGRTTCCAALADCWALECRSWTWKQVRLEVNEIGALHSHAASRWRNFFVISGGLNPAEEPTSGVYFLRVARDAAGFSGVTTRLAVQPDLSPRYGHTSCVLGDSLYLIGGVSFQWPPPGVDTVCLTSGHATPYSMQFPPHTGPVLLTSHDNVHSGAGRRIVVVGGGGNCFSFGTHINSGLYVFDLPAVDT